MIPGIDVSRMQREINWNKIKTSGVKFAFIRATEFPEKTLHLNIDKQLTKNIEGASENRIHWGAIHLFRTHIDPIIQAKVFCKTVGQFCSLPPVIELKESGTKGERLNYKARLMVENVEKISGKKPIIFTTEGFWRSYMCFEKKSHTEWARDYHLWISQYTSLWPTSIYPWVTWNFWQHSEKGEIPGIDTNVNLNWFNGSENDMIDQYISSNNSFHQMKSSFTVDSRQAKMILVEKFQKNNEMPNNYRGDFQEPNRQYRQTYSPRSEMAYKQPKFITENGNSNREEDWISTYFSQTA